MNLARRSMLLAPALLAVLAACSQVTPPTPSLETADITINGFGSPDDDIAYGVAAYGSAVYSVGEAWTGPDQNAVIRKTSKAGKLIWEDVFGNVGSQEQAEDVVADSKGNAYVLGTTTGNLAAPAKGGNDVFIRKYGPDKKVLWTQQFGSASNDGLGDLELDGSGYLYATGSIGGSNITFWRRYDTNGNLQFQGLIREGKAAHGEAISADNQGNVYVAGDVFVSVSNYDSFLQKFDKLGRLQWKLRFSDIRGINDMVVNRANGDIFVTGPFDYSATDQDFAVRAFSTNRAQLFSKTFGTSKFEGVSSIGRDSSGNLYVAGQTGGSLGSSNLGGYDAFVRKLSASGDILNTVQFGSNSNDDAKGIAALSGSEIYVAGQIQRPSSTSGSQFDAFTRRLDSQLKTTWQNP